MKRVLVRLGIGLALIEWVGAQGGADPPRPKPAGSELEAKLRAWRDASRFASAHSHSGQFVVIAAKSSAPFPAPSMELRDPKRRHLMPDLLAVSCEQIRHSIYRALNVPNRKGDKIYINIQPFMAPEAPFPVTTACYADGWKYEIEVPLVAHEEKVVRIIVHALLWELANANAAGSPAEIPFWLTEGLTQWLLNTTETQLIIQPQSLSNQKLQVGQGQNAIPVWRQLGTATQGYKRDPFFEARRRLSQTAPLTFSELSLSVPDRLDSQAGETFQSSTYLFVHHLLTRKKGPDQMRTMLSLLPQFLNWQTAFLRAFNQDFPSLLAVEKWWAVMLANFTKRDAWQALPLSTGLEKLNAALGVPAQVRAATNELPIRAELTLQQAVQDMDFSRHKVTLQNTVHQLLALRNRMPTELVPLVDAYRQVLEGYVQERTQADFAADRRRHSSQSRRLLVQETLRRLDALDRQRQEWEQYRDRAANAAMANP